MIGSHKIADLPYFGYGTLLGMGHMRERYPSAEAMGSGAYDNHELTFLRYGSADVGGCSIKARPGERLLGVLYRLSQEDMDRLMEVGGEAKWYEARRIDVETSDGKRVPAVTLLVNGDRGPWIPPEAYGNLITSGAVEAGLPEPYRKRLNDIVTHAQGR